MAARRPQRHAKRHQGSYAKSPQSRRRQRVTGSRKSNTRRRGALHSDRHRRTAGDRRIGRSRRVGRVGRIDGVGRVGRQRRVLHGQLHLRRLIAASHFKRHRYLVQRIAIRSRRLHKAVRPRFRMAKQSRLNAKGVGEGSMQARPTRPFRALRTIKSQSTG